MKRSGGQQKLAEHSSSDKEEGTSMNGELDVLSRKKIFCESESRTDWVVSLDDSNTRTDASQILFLGDVALARRIGDGIEAHGSSYPFSKLPKEFFDSDVVVFNLECCLSARGHPWEPKPELMRGKAQYLDVFPRRKQRYVANLANNHFLDYGEQGALDTIDARVQSNSSYVGAEGKSVERQPLVMGTAGGTVAFLAFSPAAHPLPEPTSVNITVPRLDIIVGKVTEAKGCADVLVVSIHQGVEYSAYTDRASRRLAKAVVEAGADIVVCHHSHVVQAYERVKNSLVFYGLGNFLLDINECWRPAAACTLALRVELEGGKIRRVKMESLVLNEEWQPSMADLVLASAIRTKVDRLSLLLQTQFGRTINDLAAFHTWTGLHFRALWGMVQREGVSKTTRYYSGRVKDKLSTFWG